MGYNISIDTAQNVKLNYQLAGVGLRMLSYMLDVLIRISYVILMLILLFNLNDSFRFSSETFNVIVIIAALPLMFYPVILETLFNGQTPGKKIMRIKVVRVDGNSPTLGNYFIRWVFGIVDFQIFSGLTAIVSILVTQKGQRVGDMVAGTTVIRIDKTLSFSDIPLLRVEEEYIPIYSEVVKLSDEDVSIISRILKKTERNKNPEILKLAVDKIKEVTGIAEIKQQDYDFLNTVLKDYNYLVSRYE